jgi:hypothetical protein
MQVLAEYIASSRKPRQRFSSICAVVVPNPSALADKVITPG